MAINTEPDTGKIETITFDQPVGNVEVYSKSFLDGHFKGRTKLDVVDEAIAWWATYLRGLETQIRGPYARPEATEVEIVEVAKAANAHEFIINLPNGYQTLVGERGVRLSGGERQRIALARAFLKDAPILILDEPTSSVDIQTEALILQAMQRLTRGRTAFLITHRPTTLTKCDLVVEIDGGRISGVTPMQPSGYV
jgi:ATPase subunit of ABC transporter with duplicated ATPase domains